MNACAVAVRRSTMETTDLSGWQTVLVSSPNNPTFVPNGKLHNNIPRLDSNYLIYYLELCEVVLRDNNVLYPGRFVVPIASYRPVLFVERVSGFRTGSATHISSRTLGITL